MCGIIGYSNSSKWVVDIASATKILKHRGPDDDGVFIEENIGKELSNKTLSDHLNISEDYVGQFFKNNVGFPPQDYIEHRRMEKAIKMLREDSEAIKVISNDVGFRDTAYFCRRFKMMFGVQAGKMKKRLNEI